MIVYFFLFDILSFTLFFIIIYMIFFFFHVTNLISLHL